MPRALLQHQQSQLGLLLEYALLHRRHLLRLQVVDVHPHRRTHALCTFQCAVVVGQTGVVHLHQTRLHRLVSLSDSRHILFLEPAVAQCQIFLSRADGTHHFHPVLLINYMYTHSH